MNEDELNRMLHTWKAEVDLPPSFQRDVWRRIEAGKPATPVLARLLEPFLNWLARPLPATVACALALTVGLTAGSMVGSANLQPAAAYAASINPVAKVPSP